MSSAAICARAASIGRRSSTACSRNSWRGSRVWSTPARPGRSSRARPSMGAEAICPCRWPGGAGEVKALLETRELILRGALGRVFPFAEMTAIRVEDGALCFSAAGEAIALELGSDRAGRWAGKIANPPTLAARLGLAVVADAPSLEAALRRHESLLPSAPIWIVHGKGKRAGIGDNEVRGFMCVNDSTATE